MTSDSQVSSALRAGMALSPENGGSFVGMLWVFVFGAHANKIIKRNVII